METRTDRFGRIVTRTTMEDLDVFSTDGIVLRLPSGSSWKKALYIIEGHAPSQEEQ